MKTDADEIRDRFGERLWKTPDELTPKAKRILDRTRRRIPEFTTKAIDAAAKSLRKELEKRLREL